MSNIQKDKLKNIPTVTEYDSILGRNSLGEVEEISAPSCGQFLGKTTTGKWGKRTISIAHTARSVNFILNQTIATQNTSVNTVILNGSNSVTINNPTDCTIRVEMVINTQVTYTCGDIPANEKVYSRWDLGHSVVSSTGGATVDSAEPTTSQATMYFENIFPNPQSFYQGQGWVLFITIPAGGSIQIGHYSANRGLWTNPTGIANIGPNSGWALTKIYKTYFI